MHVRVERVFVNGCRPVGITSPRSVMAGMGSREVGVGIPVENEERGEEHIMRELIPLTGETKLRDIIC